MGSTNKIFSLKMVKNGRNRLGRFHIVIKRKIKEESHALEFRMNQRFDEMIEYLKKQTDTFQKLADQVIGEHKKFEVESVVFPAGKSI